MGTRWRGKKRSTDQTRPELEVSYGEGEPGIGAQPASVLLPGELTSPSVKPSGERESLGERGSSEETDSSGEDSGCSGEDSGSSMSKDSFAKMIACSSMIEDSVSVNEGSHSMPNSSDAFSGLDESNTSFGGATSEASTSQVNPLPLSTASSRKLSYLMSSLISSPRSPGIQEERAALKGFRIVPIEKLAEIVCELCCNVCNSHVVLTENIQSRHGVVTRIEVKCTSCYWSTCLCNPTSSESKAFNSRVVLSGRQAGKGEVGWIP